MNITFRQGSEELTGTVLERAQEKISKLSRFIDTDEEAFVYVDIERESAAHTAPDRWRTSINLEFPGSSFNAIATGQTPEKATDTAIQELKREVRKAKGKRRSIAKRGHELLKRLRRSEPDA